VLDRNTSKQAFTPSRSYTTIYALDSRAPAYKSAFSIYTYSAVPNTTLIVCYGTGRGKYIGKRGRSGHPPHYVVCMPACSSAVTVYGLEWETEWALTLIIIRIHSTQVLSNPASSC